MLATMFLNQRTSYTQNVNKNGERKQPVTWRKSYIMSIAFAKKVQMKGRDKVSNSPLNAYSKTKDTTERKKSTQ